MPAYVARKDSESGDSTLSYTSAPVPAQSHWRSTHSTPWPSPVPPPQSKQQRILGANVGEQLQRGTSRRWFGHALRNSEYDDPAAKYGIGRGIAWGPDSAHLPKQPHAPSRALRPASVPRTPGSGGTAESDLSPRHQSDEAALPRELPPQRQSVAAVELPAKEHQARATMTSSIGDSVRDSDQILPGHAFAEDDLLDRVRADRVLGPISELEATSWPTGADRASGMRVIPPPLTLPELAEGTSLAKSPRKSPGFRATAMSALRGSGMTVPFALASPRNWKKTVKLPPDEGVPF